MTNVMPTRWVGLQARDLHPFWYDPAIDEDFGLSVNPNDTYSDDPVVMDRHYRFYRVSDSIGLSVRVAEQSGKLGSRELAFQRIPDAKTIRFRMFAPDTVERLARCVERTTRLNEQYRFLIESLVLKIPPGADSTLLGDKDQFWVGKQQWIHDPSWSCLIPTLDFGTELETTFLTLFDDREESA